MLVKSLFNKIRLPNNKNYNEYCNIILLLISIVFTIVYSSISHQNRKHISDILTTDITLYFIIFTIIIASYYNLLIGFTLCVIFIIMILPFFNNNSINSINNKKEGFKLNNNDNDNDSNETDKDIEHLINAFKGKGSKTSKILQNVKDNESKLKRLNAYKGLNNKNGNNKKKVEQFEEDELRIVKRKFNPNDEYDNNLKMTMEICDDIKERITYKYEEIPYLKKYVATKIQQIIDLLELSKD